PTRPPGSPLFPYTTLFRSPEESTNTSFGLVLQPLFIPERFGQFTFTVDRWKIQQEEIVGLLGAQAALIVDYLDRVNGGSNPLVVDRKSTRLNSSHVKISYA